NKIIIIVAVVVIALILAVVFVWPQYQKLQTLNFDITNKKEELLSRETYFSQVKEISTKLQEYQDALSKISDALPKESSLASLFNFLQTNSAQTGLILNKISLGGTTAPTESEKFLTETRIVIQVSGSYKAFKDFLTLVENSSRLIEIESVSIDIPNEKSEEPPTFNLKLKAISY
ncbi:MAG: type 4a pilus biogenesis protein PilO, partial [Candidatus Nealsonbacteria bacterium]